METEIFNNNYQNLKDELYNYNSSYKLKSYFRNSHNNINHELIVETEPVLNIRKINKLIKIFLIFDYHLILVKSEKVVTLIFKCGKHE